MSTQAHRASRGFTAIELAVSLVLASTILAVGTAAVSRSFSATRDLDRTGDGERRVELSIERIEAALADATRTSCSSCAAPAGASSVTFNTVGGFVSSVLSLRGSQTIEWVASPADATLGSVVWRRDVGQPSANTVTLVTNVPALAPGETANGADDNGDGLTDERGLSFLRTGNAIRVRLATQRKNKAGQLVAVTTERTVALRN